MQPRELLNQEGNEEFNRNWHWAARTTPGGFTAVMRVKNEARSLRYVLPPLLRSVDRVVMIDNQSTDGTAALAESIAAEMSAQEELTVLEYPFAVARCGREHLETPPNSVHSLTYFYNWSFSHVDTAYALKWDGDMVLTVDGENALQQLAWRLESSETVITIPRFPLYLRSEREAYIDTALRNREPWAWPNRQGFWFGKGMEWEIQLRPRNVPVVTVPDWVCFEIKWLDEDEFAHWTSPEDFDNSGRTVRKQREWEVYHALAAGNVPDGVVAVTSEGEEDVVEVVRTMPRREWIERTRALAPA